MEINAASSVLKRLSLCLLREITNDFSKDRVLGQCGYGIVYKGVVRGGDDIAVRVLNPIPQIDEELFENEVASLNKMRHHNVLRIIGYCSETKQVLLPYNGRHAFSSVTKRALCYEYMHNGSLDRHISDITSGLDWSERYAIIKGVCLGLRHLHEGSTSPVYHLDLKPSNIFLDQNMTPKISDFGLHRLFGKPNVRQMGPIEFMPPEFVERQVISHKFDVYSLGVVIIKVMTGMGCNDVSSDEFVDLVHTKWRERLQKTVNGTSVERQWQQVKKCIEIALGCVNYDRHERPTIGEIVNSLNEIETWIPEEVRPVPNRFYSRKSMLLDVDPLELYFPFMLKGRNKDISSCCLLQLKNRGDDRVAFMLVANIPKRYLTKKSICGVVAPRSANTITLKKLKQTALTSSDSSDFFTLYSTVVGQYDLLDAEKDYTHYNSFFMKSTEYGDKVQVVKLKVICDRSPAKSTGTSPEDCDRVSPRNCSDVSFFTLKTRAGECDRKIL